MEEPSAFMLFMNVTNTITHLVLGAVAISAIIFAIIFPGSNHLLQHVYLCVVGVSTSLISLTCNSFRVIKICIHIFRFFNRTTNI